MLLNRFKINMEDKNNFYHKITTIFLMFFLFSCATSKNNLSSNSVTALAIENTASLTETYWRLTELMGQPIPRVDNEKEIFMRLKIQDNSVHGFSGCNMYNGKYGLENGNRITFSKFATTLMACGDMSKEKEFMEVLEKSDNYAIKGNILSLNKSKMAPLAKFEAVLMK